MCVVSKANHKSKPNPPKPEEEYRRTVRTQLDATTCTISHQTIGAIYRKKFGQMHNTTVSLEYKDKYVWNETNTFYVLDILSKIYPINHINALCLVRKTDSSLTWQNTYYKEKHSSLDLWMKWHELKALGWCADQMSNIGGLQDSRSKPGVKWCHWFVQDV